MRRRPSGKNSSKRTKVRLAPDERRQTSAGDAGALAGRNCIHSSKLPSHEDSVRSNSFSPEHTVGKLKAELSQSFS